MHIFQYIFRRFLEHINLGPSYQLSYILYTCNRYKNHRNNLILKSANFKTSLFSFIYLCYKCLTQFCLTFYIRVYTQNICVIVTFGKKMYNGNVRTILSHRCGSYEFIDMGFYCLEIITIILTHTRFPKTNIIDLTSHFVRVSQY